MRIIAIVVLSIVAVVVCRYVVYIVVDEVNVRTRTSTSCSCAKLPMFLFTVVVSDDVFTRRREDGGREQVAFFEQDVCYMYLAVLVILSRALTLPPPYSLRAVVHVCLCAHVLVLD